LRVKWYKGSFTISMNSKWGFAVASILIPVVAIVVGFTNREIRCFFRLNSEEVCQTDFANIELIIQSKKLVPLENVQIRIISKGAPESRLTDTNGYVRLRIPSRGDIETIFSKEGYETTRQIINLENDPDRTRSYQLNEIVSQPSSLNSSNPPSPVTSNPALLLQSDCTKVQGQDAEEFSTDISVGLRPRHPDGRVYLQKGASRITTCRITQNSGAFEQTYGIPDNSFLSQVRISFYLDGNLAESLDVARGEAKTINLVTSKNTSYAVIYKVISVEQQDGDYLYYISNSDK
jgi:hypothetical protein